MPVPYPRGKAVNWQHTISFSNQEKEIIEKFMKDEDETTFNRAIRKIIRRCGKDRGYI